MTVTMYYYMRPHCVCVCVCRMGATPHVVGAALVQPVVSSRRCTQYVAASAVTILVPDYGDAAALCAVTILVCRAANTSSHSVLLH